MKKIFTTAAAATLLAASASAWWSNPFSDFADEFFGGGESFFDLNMNVSASASGQGQGYGYDRAYYGPYAYAPFAYGYPQAAAQTPAPLAGNQ